MSLDTLYGICGPAGRPIEDWERRLPPLTLTELTAGATASAMNSFFTSSPSLQLTAIFARAYHVLWLIDDAGRIWIAIEEVIDDADRQIGALALSRKARPLNPRKLGHPSLLFGQASLEARIGGEITYDPAWDGERDWVLSNASGRYGLRQGQTEDHLVAACGLFAELGLYFGYRFITPVV